MFLAPPVFDFPNQGTWVQSKDIGTFAGYVTVGLELGDCMKGTYVPESITIKAPDTKGKYVVYYRVYCEGFDSDYKSFEVTVE